MKRIVVLVDMTESGKPALIQAAVIARRSGAELVALNITGDKHASDEYKGQVEEFVRGAIGEGVPFKTVIGTGDFMEAIPEYLAELLPDLVVMCTHGIHGIAQNLFGAHVLKLVGSMQQSCLVVQENTKVAQEGIQRMLIPASPFPDYMEKIRSAAALASVFGAELYHYEIDKYLGGTEEAIAANRIKGAEYLSEQGLTLLTILEDNTTMSLGFAQQTMKYAHENGMNAVVVSADTHKQEMPMGKADKESFLTNEFGIPVLVSPK